MNLRPIAALAALAALAVGGTAKAQNVPAGQVAQTTPAPTARPTAAPSAGAAPAASATPAPRRGRRGASPEPSPSESPAPPQFSTMDGVWEVQLQPLTGARTIYSHLYVSQRADNLTGTWVRSDKTKIPFTGTFDGRLFKLTATDAASKTTWTMAGYAENFSDMVGLVTSTDPKDKGTPFTASHRKKERIGI